MEQTPDLRFLGGAPAGRHGFVTARGESLVFEDGTPARFWGVNVVADAIFRTPDALIDAEAERLARLGFNLVRLHHHDSGSWVNPNVIAPAGSEILDPVAMRKLDRWIAKLKEQGIYVWLDLHTGRVFRPDQGIPGFAELKRGADAPKAKGFLYLNERLQELTLAFADAFLGHRNELTGLRYRDDPAIAAVLVSNENDLSHHFGNLFAADKGTPWHRERLREAASELSARTGLPVDALLRTWEPGPAKLLLADLEHRVAERARAHLRETGVRVPIAFTSYWGSSGTSALAALSAGDFVDVHSYGGGAVLRSDPRKQLGFLGWIGAGHLANEPLTVSEWNHGKPLQRERYEAHLWMASIAALQDWDGLMLFAYAQKSFARPRASLWNAARDPATLPLMPAAALLYRRGDVAPARQRVVLTPTREQVFAEAGAPQRFLALPGWLEQSRVSLALPAVKELPWLRPPAPLRGRVVSDVTHGPIGADATRVVSDTGQIVRELAAGRVLGDTPLSQFAAGALSGGPVRLSHVRIDARTDAAVSLASLDGEPLDRSRRILVSVAARACAHGPSAWRAEPVRGRGWLAGAAARVLRPLGGYGTDLPLAPDGAGGSFPLDFGASWALIEPAAQSAP